VGVILFVYQVLASVYTIRTLSASKRESKSSKVICVIMILTVSVVIIKF